MPKMLSFHDRFINAVAPVAKKPSSQFFWQEFWGSGVPHVILGANLGDKVDQFYQQAAQEVGSYVATYQFSKVVARLYDAHIHTLSDEEKKIASTWKALGVGLAALPVLAVTDYSAMYLRNYLTSKTFKTHDFVDLVGLGSKQDTTKEESPVHKKDRIQFEHEQLKIIGTAVGLGFLTAALGSGWAYRQMKRSADLPKFLTREFKIPFLPKKTSLYDWFSFKDGNMDNINGGQVFSTFGAFAYAGLILGARKSIERWEGIVKFAWYGFANMIIPNAVEKRLENKFNQMAKGNTDKKAVYSFLTKVGTGALLYAVPSTLLCLFTRKDRVKALQAKEAAEKQKSSPRVTQKRPPQTEGFHNTKRPAYSPSFSL